LQQVSKNEDGGCQPEAECGLGVWSTLVLPCWWSVVATVILLSTSGTKDYDIWFMCLADNPVVRSYHLKDFR